MNIGDIFVDDNFLYVVDGDPDRPYIYLYKEGTIIHEVGRKNNNDFFDYSKKKKIGNKYDNPELLKTKLSCEHENSSYSTRNLN